MDPVSAFAIATSAYQAIRKGFQIGKEVESMAGDIGKWMNAINHIKEGHNKAKGRRIGSVEEEALETFAIKKKAEKMEDELRNFIIGNYGLNGWNEIIRIQAQLRKERLEEKKRKEAQIQQLLEIGTICSLTFLIAGFIIWVAWMAYGS
jgi:chemotaxis regulatin CheY-phosphate phosphatase CheZ